MKRLLTLLASLGVMLTGCYSSYDPYYYDYAYYDPYYYGYDTAYAYSWYDPYGVYYFSSIAQAQTATIDVNAAAASIASRAPSYFSPSGCATATPSGARVTYTFSNCDGPYGGRNINGTVNVDLSQANGQLTFTGTSSDLNIDGKPFTFETTAVGTANGAQRTLNITSKSRFPDQVQSRETQGTLTWQQGSGCTELNSQSTSTVSGATVNSTITGLKRCIGQCPTAGTVRVDSPDGPFNATFDGSSTIRVIDPRNESKDFDMQCG